ncbi:hypothetical protein N7535_008338 [Penicillium sp. DV-2018c]|nr:hypothetical protein N7535_008338 [Penicillium sp. DV-2018c]
MRQEIHAVKTAATTNATGPNTRIRSYADAVRNAPPPAHLLSNNGNVPAPAAPTESIHDRRVIVKVGDSDGVKHFRKRTCYALPAGHCE